MTISLPPISYPTKPVPPFSKEPPENLFPFKFPTLWRDITGRPYVTVSSKGLANGRSEYFNNGADFGPDTPGTETSGIQEIINYAMKNNISIFIEPGQYIISAPLTQDPVTLNYAQIHIPVPSSPFQSLYIVAGGAGPIGYSYPGAGTTSQPNNLVYDGPTPNYGVQLLSTNKSPESSNVSSVLMVDGDSSNTMSVNYVDIFIQGSLRITIQPGYIFTAFNFYKASSVRGDELIADLELTQSNDIPNPLNANGNTTAIDYGFAGIAFPTAGSMGNNAFKSIYVVGYWVGVAMLSHNIIDVLYIQSCYYAITMYDIGHTNIITYANIQQCPFTLYNRFPNGNAKLMIMQLDMEVNYNITSGPEEWMNFVADYKTAGANLEGIIYYHKQGINSTTETNNTFYYNSGTSPLPQNFKAICLDGNYPPTLSANPPVSATVYQNTNSYDIEIDLPAYATTAGTAGYVTVAKGATSTPTAISNQYISGGTTSTSTDIVRLRVPAGWYYEFTASGVTFGTASVFAE